MRWEMNTRSYAQLQRLAQPYLYLDVEVVHANKYLRIQSQAA